MKTLLQFTLGTALFAQYAMAQPTITASGMNPIVGDVFLNVSGSYINPGSSGANQAWNFSSITGNTSTVTVVNASSTTYSASFAASNIATTGNGTSFEYFNASASAYQAYGSANSSFVNSYSNPEDKLHFPFTYTNSFTDVFSSTYMNGGTTIYRTGLNSVNADAYGTLTTPAGTFSNVLRIHYTMSYHDSSNTGGTPAVTQYQRDQYLWYLDGNHSALAALNSFTITPPSGSPISNQSAIYLSNPATTSISHPEQAPSLTMFPNPVSDALHILFIGTISKEATITLYNSLGVQVGAIAASDCAEGTNKFHVSVINLPEGIYFAQLTQNGKLSEVKRFIISR